MREQVVDVHLAGIEASSASSADASMSELVVALTFFRVAKYVVGLCNLLELLFGVLVPWVLVGVVLYRQFAEGFLDFFVRSCSLDAKYFVIILFHDG